MQKQQNPSVIWYRLSGWDCYHIMVLLRFCRQDNAYGEIYQDIQEHSRWLHWKVELINMVSIFWQLFTASAVGTGLRRVVISSHPESSQLPSYQGWQQEANKYYLNVQRVRKANADLFNYASHKFSYFATFIMISQTISDNSMGKQ